MSFSKLQKNIRENGLGDTTTVYKDDVYEIVEIIRTRHHIFHVYQLGVWIASFTSRPLADLFIRSM